MVTPEPDNCAQVCIAKRQITFYRLNIRNWTLRDSLHNSEIEDSFFAKRELLALDRLSMKSNSRNVT